MIGIADMSNDKQLEAALKSIDGLEIEKDLINFAAIGGVPVEGRPDQPVRNSPGRVALTEIDVAARDMLADTRLANYSLPIHRHPVCVVGGLIGSDPELEPIVIVSHTDTVPKADMYDGVYGVFGGVAVLDAITKYGVPHKRTILLVAVSLEESSGFGTALAASKIITKGMSEETGNARLTAGKPSIAETIEERFGEEGLEQARKPLFGDGAPFPKPFAAIELHVEQSPNLDESGTDLGVVDVIAAPVRHELTFGSSKPLEVDTKEYEHVKYFELQINGKADHSGARPMGDENRADGLVQTAAVLKELLEFDGAPSSKPGISIGEINIDGQAINKVPGVTKTQIRVTASSKAALDSKVKLVQQLVRRRENYIANRMPRFDKDSLSLSELEQPKGEFFDPQQMSARHIDFFDSVVRLSELATYASADKVVGTIGTVTTSKDGVITAGIDVRGVDAASRDEMFEGFQYYLWHETSGKLGPRKAGDSDPVNLDPSLVRTVSQAIERHDIGSYKIMYSAAGHDAQNFQRADIPTALIFVPSENGVAHNPDAYTAPEFLAKGVRALLATVVQLANAA